jgi:cytochrome c biogenesis protein CcmG/thiol:disulfide interchange protein DsbE
VTSPHRRTWLAWAGLFVPLLVLLALLAAGTTRHQGTLAVSEALARGETPEAPALSMPTFSGGAVSLAAFRGHPVILNFWASWCLPCREEAPLLEATWRQYRTRGLVVVGVDTEDLLSPARGFISEYHLTFPTARDPDGTVARRFGTTGVPETFFITTDGRIVGKFPGEQTSPDAWQRASESVLAGRSPDPAR